MHPRFGDAFARACFRMAYRCTYGDVYSSSHRRGKESNGRRRRREGRRPLAAPQRLISSSCGW